PWLYDKSVNFCSLLPCPTRRSSDLMKKTLWIFLLALALGSACVVRTYGGPPVYAAGVEPVSVEPIYWYEGFHLLSGGGYCYMEGDRKSTRLNSSHDSISYAVFSFTN